MTKAGRVLLDLRARLDRKEPDWAIRDPPGPRGPMGKTERMATTEQQAIPARKVRPALASRGFKVSRGFKANKARLGRLAQRVRGVMRER